MNTSSTQVRLSAIGIVAVCLFAALFVRLWFLQGVDPQRFEAATESNRLRVIHEEGPRGRILDRNGRIIVDNRTTIVVALDREPLRKLDDAERSAVFADLADTLTDLGVPTKLSTVERRFADVRYSPQETVPVADEVPEDVELYLAERANRFPGVVVERRTVRTYPYGSLAAQVIGYVGESNADELATVGGDAAPKAADGTPKEYQPGDSFGKGGIESAQEAVLRGVPGRRTIEVNARGEFLAETERVVPQAGDDVWLSLDLDLQAHAERLLAAKIKSLRGQKSGEGTLNAPQGSVVIIQPGTGQVLAMASYPSYNPSILVNGISTDLWEQLNDPNSGRPLVNWAIQGAYAPGSTFKPVTALAGWRAGIIGPGNEKYVDGGTYRLQNCEGAGCTFQNAGRKKLGEVDLARSLAVSSDTYYYRLAELMWLNRWQFGDNPIQDVAVEFGLGEPTGIDLPGEAGGRVPTPAQRRAAFEANPDVFMTGDWFTGDTVITSIGQGDVLVTPLQLAELYATIASGGVRHRPQAVFQVTRPLDPAAPPGQPGNFEIVRKVEPEEVGRVEMGGEFYLRVLAGLIGVTQDDDGTASRSWASSPTAWVMGGKTGTAQVVGKADSALFAGWGPVASGIPPEFAVSVIIPESGFGGDVAAPLAFRILAPASDGTLSAACTVAAAAQCREAEGRAAQASVADVGSGGPG
jgi:penicillin-binding protein 2